MKKILISWAVVWTVCGSSAAQLDELAVKASDLKAVASENKEIDTPPYGGVSVSSDTCARLGLPTSGTVLTLQGLNFNLYNKMPAHFQGVLNRPPYFMKKVRYPASLASNSITVGVSNLDAALKSTPGPKIVLAHSQGAQVSSRWMREHAGDPTAPKPEELTFVLTGNPLRSDGGGYIIGRKEVGGTIGVPTPMDTPWHIIDVARRYDGWADWPADADNSTAVRNAKAGKFRVHTKYDVIDINDPLSTVWTRGNTTYVLTYEDALPLLHGEKDVPPDVVEKTREEIESAYNRPPEDAK